MPRLARLDAAGVLHHVIIRGIERRKIFRDNKDRNNLLDRLETLLPETKCTCYAWSFLDNHAHFLLRTGPTHVATLMRRLLTGYAVYFNRRHRRHGQLFQNRYKSIICQEDAYFKELVRYIHLNPLRAKKVYDISKLNSYAYCGHSVLMGIKKRPWQDVGYVLSDFGKSLREARKRYLDYVKEGIEQGKRPELVGGGLIRSLGGWQAVKEARLKVQGRIKGDQRILGDSAFVLDVLTEAEEKFERFYELKSKGYDLERIELKVCEIFGLEPDELYSRSRQKERAQARGLYCYWAVEELGYSLVDLAKRFGMTGHGVGYAVRRGERIAKENNYSLFDGAIELLTDVRTSSPRPQPHGTVSVSMKSQDRDSVMLTVKDTGIGIDPTDTPHIFNRFFRCDQSRTQSGVGLGLSLARTIARAHGGDITATSQPNEGSTFTVTLSSAH